MNPREAYQARLGAGTLHSDSAQAAAVEHLQRLHDELLEQREVFFLRRWFATAEEAPVKGLYLWGGVGTGKTMLMDLLFESLPPGEKRRIHFHRFMKWVHDRRRAAAGAEDPLVLVAEELAAENRLLCLDEFAVTDIADAMILHGLLRHLFRLGVSLVTTSNTPPPELYRDGLQRDRFLPAIALLERHTEVVRVDGGADYRARFLAHSEVYHTPLDAAAESALDRCWERVAGGRRCGATPIWINGRRLQALCAAADVAWFDFAELFRTPRSRMDYIELARCYHTLLVSDIPVLGAGGDDAARRLIEAVDEFYDRAVKLVVSAAAPPGRLYTGQRLAEPFARTASRLREMASREYLERPHRS